MDQSWRVPVVWYDLIVYGQQNYGVEKVTLLKHEGGRCNKRGNLGLMPQNAPIQTRRKPDDRNKSSLKKIRSMSDQSPRYSHNSGGSRRRRYVWQCAREKSGLGNRQLQPDGQHVSWRRVETASGKLAGLLRQHVLDLLFAQQNVVDRLSSVLEGSVITVEVGRQEDLGIPHKALAR